MLCTERAVAEAASRRNTLYLAIPANAPGVKVVGDWDPLGMRGTVSRTLLFKDVFVSAAEMLMPHGVYFQAATRWPHMFLTLSPTYMGLAQAAYDFTVRYLRGEMAGTPSSGAYVLDQADAVAEMRVMLEQTKALWFQAITEARVTRARARCAPMPRSTRGDEGMPNHRSEGDPYRRQGAEEPAARAHLPRQPLRLTHAAVDRRNLPRPARA